MQESLGIPTPIRTQIISEFIFCLNIWVKNNIFCINSLSVLFTYVINIIMNVITFVPNMKFDFFGNGAQIYLTICVNDIRNYQLFIFIPTRLKTYALTCTYI